MRDEAAFSVWRCGIEEQYEGELCVPEALNVNERIIQG
jgi:hypothetical protein